MGHEIDRVEDADVHYYNDEVVEDDLQLHSTEQTQKQVFAVARIRCSNRLAIFLSLPGDNEVAEVVRARAHVHARVPSLGGDNRGKENGGLLVREVTYDGGGDGALVVAVGVVAFPPQHLG